jgi:hypothetical protein
MRRIFADQKNQIRENPSHPRHPRSYFLWRKPLTAGCNDRIRDNRGGKTHVAHKPKNRRGRLQPARSIPESRAGVPKGAVAMIYGEPETPRFLAALQRLKRQQRKKERQTRLAKQRVRVALRKMRPS